MVTKLEQAIYTAHATATGGREGRAVGQQLVDAAHLVCPYSNATRGNIVVDLSLA